MLSEDITPGKGTEIVQLLERRSGLKTVLHLVDGSEIEAFNSVWGRDFGAEWEHLTLNGSPLAGNRPVHFVMTSDIVLLIAPETGEILYKNLFKQ